MCVCVCGGVAGDMNNQFPHFNSTCCLVFMFKEMNECITCRTISHRAAALHTKTREGGVERMELHCLNR